LSYSLLPMDESAAAAAWQDTVSGGQQGSAGTQPAEECQVPLAERDAVQELRDQKKDLMQQKKMVTKQLRNELRKRLRLRERAKKLSDEDLVKVLACREKERQARGSAKSRAAPARARK
jgi:hypothetical protein